MARPSQRSRLARSSSRRPRPTTLRCPRYTHPPPRASPRATRLCCGELHDGGSVVSHMAPSGIALTASGFANRAGVGSSRAQPFDPVGGAGKLSRHVETDAAALCCSRGADRGLPAPGGARRRPHRAGFPRTHASASRCQKRVLLVTKVNYYSNIGHSCANSLCVIFKPRRPRGAARKPRLSSQK